MNLISFPFTSDYSALKREVENILEKLGLQGLVRLNELSSAISMSGHIHESPLLVGIITRCSETGNYELIERLVPLFATWKNFLPREELGGLSPVEFEQRYPRGVQELWILDKLLENYQGRLREFVLNPLNHPQELNLAEDFANFQGEFMNMVPARQPFPEISLILTHREIIAEERSRRGFPTDQLKELRIILFADNTDGHLAKAAAQLENTYRKAIERLAVIYKTRPRKNLKKSLEGIFKKFISIEPFMRCTSQADEFYADYAMAAFLVGRDTLTLKLIKKSLALNPVNPHSQELRERLENFKEG